ncbi:MAG: 6-phosphogluconolactonase [Nanoarchaeota archaeon]|nr:6-phosphogluconolactonase [Nanoarchaeota archaeon]
MEIIQGERKEAERKAADAIAAEINNLLTLQDTVTLGLVGGTSVAGVYDWLKETVVEWKNVQVFLVDERMVDIDDDESNFKLIRTSFTHDLVTTGKMPQKNIHPFIYSSELKDLGLVKYLRKIEDIGKKYDVIVVSAGEDGHIGALFPRHHSLASDAECLLVMDDSPKPPALRLTISREMVLRSKVGFVLFFGSGKKDAYAAFSNLDTKIADCPASLLHHLPKAYAVTDLS